MAHQYTNVEFSEMVRILAQCNDNVLLAQRRYVLNFPNRRRPSRATILAATQRLRDFGQFRAPAAAGGAGAARLPVHLEENILNYVYRHPDTSTRLIANRFGISQRAAWLILNRDNQRPYHLQKVQELGQADYGPRLEFCQWLLVGMRNIIFTDECTFTRIGLYNTRNEHVWSRENPHAVRVHNHQRRFKLNVWAAMVNSNIIGPYFLPELNGARYLAFLEENLGDILDQVPLEYLHGLWFQHDGAPPHFSIAVRNHLNLVFENRWIGRGGPVQWPARSPDLTPLDFYLWGHVKALVYKEASENIEILKQRIETAFDTVKEEAANFAIRQNLRRRAELCIRVNGGHFENILRYN